MFTSKQIKSLQLERRYANLAIYAVVSVAIVQAASTLIAGAVYLKSAEGITEFAPIWKHFQMIEKAELILFTASAIVFLMWFRKSYGNLRLIDCTQRYRLWWSVWGWFIPVFSLFRPYQILKEINQAYDPERQTGDRVMNALIVIYWIMWCTSWSIGNRVLTMDPQVQAPATIREYTMTSGFGTLFSVVAGILIIKIIQRILNNQKIVITRKMHAPAPTLSQQKSA